MKKSESLKRSEWASFKTAMFGLAGVSIVFLLHILSVPTLDRALHISLYCHAVSIPLLVGIALSMDFAEHWPARDIPLAAHMATMPLMIGPWLTFAGVAGCIWHYSVGAALSFIGASLVAGLAFGMFQHRILRTETAATETQPARDEQP